MSTQWYYNWVLGKPFAFLITNLILKQTVAFWETHNLVHITKEVKLENWKPWYMQPGPPQQADEPNTHKSF